MADSSTAGVAPPPATESPGTATGEATTGGHPHTAPIAVAQEPDDDDDGDSALGADAESSTASLNSSIFEYRKLHGRTYHKETGSAQYWGTNDSTHSESLDVLHHLFTLLLDGELVDAPIANPKKVLDVGTGTGIWAIDFADKYPDCEVIGTDISPIQPGWVPPNCRFEMEDCTQEWTFPPNTFDLVHIRYLIGCIIDWTAFFQQAYKVLKPGAYLQSWESSPKVYTDDNTMPPDLAVAQWETLFTEGGRKLGRSFTVIDDGTQRRAMEEAGFVDIHERWFKVPSGGWPKDPKLRQIGEFSQFALLSDVEGFILFLTNVVGWSKDEVHVYIARLRKELQSGKHHVYYMQKLMYGRKPETAT